MCMIELCNRVKGRKYFCYLEREQSEEYREDKYKKC